MEKKAKQWFKEEFGKEFNKLEKLDRSGLYFYIWALRSDNFNLMLVGVLLLIAIVVMAI